MQEAQERESLEGIFEDLKQEQKLLQKKRYIILGSFGILMGIYLFFLLFGSNSWSVLLALRKEREMLREKTQLLQNKNVELQKIIFELKGLEPTNEE